VIALPPQVVINSINDFCVLYFKDLNHEKDAPSHFHIVFPVNNESGLILTIITKQIDKRIDYYQRRQKEDAVNALVFVDKDIFDFLTQKSVADCNRAELLTKTELLQRIDLRKEMFIKCRDIPSFLKKEICSAIRKSPLISPQVKKMVKEVLKSI